MKLLQINVSVNSGSHGRIAEDIGRVLMSDGHESYIAYGRRNLYSISETINIGGTLDLHLHVLISRLFDLHGFSSARATKIFIKEIKAIDPDIIHLHNIHGYYINAEVLFNYLKYAGKRSGGYPWCASFGHWCLGQNGIEGNGPIGNDWLTFGQKLNQPALGAIVIFNKPDGHFGFIAGKYKDGSLVIIHGNWSDKVTLGNQYQPIPLNRIKSIRYPAGYTPNYNLPVIGVN